VAFNSRVFKSHTQASKKKPLQKRKANYDHVQQYKVVQNIQNKRAKNVLKNAIILRSFEG
jgi:hypothetical protein